MQIFSVSTGCKMCKNLLWKCRKFSKPLQALSCWLFQELLGDASHFDFDCVPPIMTLSMFPEMLDLNRDGFWSTEECEQLESQLQGEGTKEQEATEVSRTTEQRRP